jgi:hypothetical protein
MVADNTSIAINATPNQMAANVRFRVDTSTMIPVKAPTMTARPIATAVRMPSQKGSIT